MSIFQKHWVRFRVWLKSLARDDSTADSITDNEDRKQVVSEFQEQRDSRHTIRVNLAILEKELTELKRIARKATPSFDLAEARELLDQAEKTLLVDMGLFSLSEKSAEELSDILGQVFAAMRKTTRARRLLRAC